MPHAVADFICASGYTEDALKRLELTKTPWRESSVRQLLAEKVDTRSILGTLIRLFFFGESVQCEELRAIPREIVAGMSDLRLIQQEGAAVVPACMLVHFGGLLLACDSVRRARSGQWHDLVLGVNRPTQVLASLTVPVAGEAALDLGTGCGPLVLGLAARFKTAIGTDINPRSLEFASLNAALNGRPNCEFRQGDRFMAVPGERFDLIVSNPPFFLGSRSELAFTSNPYDLDSFVESIAREAPAHLKEGGYFQMLCEWAECKGEPWRARLEEWFAGSGCDVLLLKDYEISPADYTLLRASEAASLHGAASDEDVAHQMSYFKERGVERIHGGLLTARRTGKPRNWFVADDSGLKTAAPAGDFILERFANEDILFAGDAHVLAAKPRLAPGVTLIQESMQEGRSWRNSLAYLERRLPVPRKLGFDAEISAIIGEFDGSQSLAFHAASFVKKKGMSPEQMEPEFVRLARKLASLGLITLRAN